MSNANSTGGRGSPQIMLRVPEELRDKLKSVALMERRSLNAQIVVLLEQATKTGQAA